MDDSSKLKAGAFQGEECLFGTYSWNVGILERAYTEAIKFLSKEQYRHMKQQVQEIACLDEPAMSEAVDVRSLNHLWEIRDKGGILGNINVRVYFGQDNDRRCLVVLGCYHKKANRKTPVQIIKRHEARWRFYKKGNLGYIKSPSK